MGRKKQLVSLDFLQPYRLVRNTDINELLNTRVITNYNQFIQSLNQIKTVIIINSDSVEFYQVVAACLINSIELFKLSDSDEMKTRMEHPFIRFIALEDETALKDCKINQQLENIKIN